MCAREFLKEDENTITLVRAQNSLNGINVNDIRIIRELWRKYRTKSRNELLKDVYEQYPHYATRSKLLYEVLDKEAQKRVEQHKNTEQQTVLFTIGYEGRSLENYLNALIRHGIRVLVDVRNNPVSMKPGFSRRQLEKMCRNVEIEYRHVPEVGIAPEQRKGLKLQEDYDELFAAYRREMLPATVSIQQEILKLLQYYRRIALTCFEAESRRCNRSHLAEAISRLPGFSYEVEHL